MERYTEDQLSKLGLGWQEKLALWVLVRWEKEMKLNLNFSNYTAADYARLVATAATAFGAGFAQGGYVTGGITALVAIVTLLQTPPAHTAEPNQK